MAPRRTAPRVTERHPAAPTDEPVVSRPEIEIKTPRERIDVVLRFCQEDDPFVVDWAPPQR
jgi:hypothetical protein